MKAFAAALLLAISGGAQAEGRSAEVAAAGKGIGEWRINRWSPHIREASLRFGIPEQWIRRVIRAESGGRTMLDGRPIASRAGAMGLMQLMPGTWAEMRARHGLGADPHQPRDNILAGTAYLRAMHDRFGYPGLFAAYNAGPQRYAEHLTMRRRLPAETVQYVAAVASSVPRSSAARVKQVRGTGMFVTLAGAGAGRVESDSIAVAGTLLFVQLSTRGKAAEE